jgi:hypothetical protein
MRRALFVAGNVAAGVALVLLALDPARDLTPIVALLAVAPTAEEVKLGRAAEEVRQEEVTARPTR